MKRGQVPFDSRYFEKLRRQGKALTVENTFRKIYESNHWSGSKTASGIGSDDDQTREISVQIPKLISDRGIQHLLDVPCGDFYWFSKLDISLESYTGGDILPEIVKKNNDLYKNKRRKFLKIDILKDPLPEADILLCRDCLVHLSLNDIFTAIQNIKNSSVGYLLTTTFTGCEHNEDITTGDWRIINLELAPFNFPGPLQLINEKCTESGGTYADKCLGLWKISDL